MKAGPIGPRGRCAGHTSLALTLLAVTIAGCHAHSRVADGRFRKPELVEVGYGRQERRTLAAAVASLDSANIEGQQVAFVEELLLGRIL